MSAPKLDRKALRSKLLAEFEATLDSVANAVDEARDGAWIADSEGPCRDALERFRHAAYEAAVQAKIDAAEAAFPPSAQRNHRPPTAS